MSDDHEPPAEDPVVEPVPEVDPDAERAEELASEPGGLRAVTGVKKPSTLGGIIYLSVLAAALGGLGIAATGAWRTGVSWLAGALLVAAVARVALPDENAGMLRVRGKVLDALILLGMGAAILVLAATIPNQPG